MTSSVRERIEYARNHQQEVASRPAPIKRTNQLVVGNGPTSSTRERSEAAAFQSSEQLTPLDKHRSTGLTTQVVYPGNSRQRYERQEFEVRERTEAVERQKFNSFGQPTIPGVPIFSSPEERSRYYAAEYEAEQRQKVEWEAEREREQADINRRNEERGRHNLKIFNWKIALQQAHATQEEIQKIIGIAERKFPDAPPEKLVSILWTLRDATGTKPNWAR